MIACSFRLLEDLDGPLVIDPSFIVAVKIYKDDDIIFGD